MSWAAAIFNFLSVAVAYGLLAVGFFSEQFGQRAFAIGFLGAFVVGAMIRLRRKSIMSKRNRS